MDNNEDMQAELARLRAEKIRANAALLRVTHAKMDLGPITLSMGVAIFPDHGADTTAIIKAADIALYQAKRDGRNRVIVAVERAAQPELQR